MFHRYSSAQRRMAGMKVGLRPIQISLRAMKGIVERFDMDLGRRHSLGRM
jgi:hypothetical protein